MEFKKIKNNYKNSKKHFTNQYGYDKIFFVVRHCQTTRCPDSSVGRAED
jgi:hypothetical protein